MIRQADYIVELGPGGGDDGGQIVYFGDIASFTKLNTKTAAYL
nr:hypothetical protein [Tetragenococcus halophilus]